MRILLGISLLFLAACGFTPLYEAGGSSAVMQEKLSAVDVAPIPDRIGQIMRNRLLDRLNVSAKRDYELQVVLTQTTEGYGVRPDTAITQEQLTLIAHVKLVALADETVLFEENMRARTSYDLVLSDFSTLIQREDSARRLVLQLAERIHRRLALQFANN